MMKGTLLLLAALLLAASVAWAAQTIEGKIMSVDPYGKRVTLYDGTTLAIPAGVNVHRDALKEGVTVRATFEQNGGQNIVTSILVHPEKES
jgi:Cu/Ag efflux protein CusF